MSNEITQITWHFNGYFYIISLEVVELIILGKEEILWEK
jgi:hypothetical protein